MRRPLMGLLALLWMGSDAQAGVLQQSRFYTSRHGAFLAHGAGARPVGMGEAFTALADDASAVYWNPGGLGQLTGVHALAMHNLMDKGLRLSYAAAAVPLQETVIAMSFSALSFGSYDIRDGSGNRLGTASPLDLAVSVGWGGPHHALGLPGWSGLSVEYVKETVGGGLIGFGAGSVIPISPRTSVGWVVQHLGPAQDGSSLPAVGKVGVAGEVPPFLRLAMDVGYPFAEQQLSISGGAEAQVHPRLVFRVGYKWRAGNRGFPGLTGPTAGLGTRLGDLQLDYAYQPFGEITTSHRVALAYGFRPSSEVEPKHQSEQVTHEAVEQEAGISAPEIDQELKECRVLYTAEKYDEAMVKLKEVLKRAPESWQAWALLGNCLFSKGDHEGALHAHRRSLEINPDNTQLREWLKRQEAK